MSAVDVLSSYAQDTGAFRVSNKGATELAAACAAMADSIKAMRLTDAAMLLADWNVPDRCTERQHAAYLANAVALARVGGAS